jgi:hypothetical protein
VLYQQWLDTGQLNEVRDATADPKLEILKLFYEIWGVGDTTARGFYKKGAVGHLCRVRRLRRLLLANNDAKLQDGKTSMTW